MAERAPQLFNTDLAPVPREKRTWGWFAIFNVWANDAQSLFGYTLAASLFITFGLNGWAVFAAILLAGAIMALLVNLAGKPSTKYGVPYPVMARAGMGVFGANFPAMVRAVVAIFWYGAQTYVASKAFALAIGVFFGPGSPETWLGLTLVGWISLVVVSAFQALLFWRGITTIRRFLNFAGPAVYLVMVVLLAMLWMRAGHDFLPEVGTIFEGKGHYEGGAIAAFMAVTGTMLAFHAPIIVNYGDFARYVRSEAAMKAGNVVGLLFNMGAFALLALLVTAGARVVFGETLTDPTEMIKRVDEPVLTVVAALTFFVATVGINVVANFVPPSNDLSNLLPRYISFRRGGLIAASAAFLVSALWVSVISHIGLIHFVKTLGTLLAPAYGILIADYYLIRRQELRLNEMYSTDPNGSYYYHKGWNPRALVAFVSAGIFSMLTVWLPALQLLNGFDWIIGAVLGGAIYLFLSRSWNARPT